MRRVQLGVLSVMLLAAYGPSPYVERPYGQALEAAIPAITGAQLVQQLRDAANGIVDNAGNELKGVATTAVGELLVLASQIERALGENIGKPLRELTAAFREEIERGLAALGHAQYFARATATCVKDDLQGLLASLQATLDANISSAVPWAKDTPIVTRVYRIGTDAPFGLRAGSDQTLIVEGSNLDYDARCGASVEMIPLAEGAQRPEVSLVGGDPRRLSLLVKSVATPATYDIRVALGRRRLLFGCGRPRIARASVAVLPEPKFRVEYSLTPSCTISPTTVQDVGGVDGTNDACDGDRHFGGNFVLPEPWRYVRYEWVPQSVNRCDVSHRYVGGNAVNVMARCPERGEIFCSGPRSWVHGRVLIHGIRDEVQPGTMLRGAFPTALTYGQTLSITPVTPASNVCPRNAGWSVAVSLVHPDGTRHDIPSRTGSGPLTNSADGAVFHWDPVTYTLSVTAPPNSCGGM